MICFYIFSYAILTLIIATHQDIFSGKLYEFAGTAIVTGIAAWVGGWAAFSSERKTREDAERKSRISSANKALFTIATIDNVFKNLRQFYIDIDNHRENPDRAFLMDSPQTGMMQVIHFDFDSINYFLDEDGEECSMALMELQVLDWHFQVVVNTIELRSKAFEDLHKAIKSNPIANITTQAIRTIYNAEYHRLAELTDQMIQQVDEGIIVTKKVYVMMLAALQLQFPGQSFLQIKFAEKSTNTKE
jgi:hypothetical protein